VVRVVLSQELQRGAGGVREVAVAAGNYRELVAELCGRFPAITEDAVAKHALAIDGVVIQMPLLESFGAGSELVFVNRIAGG